MVYALFVVDQESQQPVKSTITMKQTIFVCDQCCVDSISEYLIDLILRGAQWGAVYWIHQCALQLFPQWPPGCQNFQKTSLLRRITLEDRFILHSHIKSERISWIYNSWQAELEFVPWNHRNRQAYSDVSVMKPLTTELSYLIFFCCKFLKSCMRCLYEESFTREM